MKRKELQRINLAEIKNPDFLKTLNDQELELLGKDIREYILDVTSKNGGHLSSNLGSSDLTIAMCKAFNFPEDKLLFDVGHQAYTYKVLTGRRLENLRQKDGPSGYQRRSESPYDQFEAGHSSTSLSAANGMALARDLKGEKYEVVAFIGDASIVNGLAFEGLNNIAAADHKVIIVLNDNDMSISKPVGGMGNFFRAISTSSLYLSTKRNYKKMMMKTRIGGKLYNQALRFKNKVKHFLIPTTLFDNLGYTYIGPISGHNFSQMAQAFKRAKKSNRSVVIHVRTKKGFGYDLAELDKVGKWHGVSPFDVDSGEELKCAKAISWSEFYAKQIEESMENNPQLVVVTPATIRGSSLEEVWKHYPQRTIDVGIAEEHALTMASGLALNEMHPIVSIYSTFLQRAYDQISHDLARMNLDATLLIDRAGFVGSDGKTHQGIYDESFLLGIPNVTLTMASTPEIGKALYAKSIEKGHGVFGIRYPRECVIESEEKENIKDLPIGKWLKLKEGGEIALVGVGPKVRELLDLLKERKIQATLYDAVYLSPLDEGVIAELLKFKKVIIYDAYSTIHGFTSLLAMRLGQLGYKGELIIKAIPVEFIAHASIDEQEKEYGLSALQIAELF